MAILSSDIPWIVTAAALFHIHLASAVLFQDIGVIPPTAQIPYPVWDTVNAPLLSPLDANLVTSNDFGKINGYTNDYYHPQAVQTIFGTVKSPSDVFDDSLSGYYHNGRYLKQYFVAEENIDDINALNSFLSRFMPFVPNNYNVPASKLPNLGFPTVASPPPTLPTNPVHDFYSIQRVSPVPVQLGSGSLGYVRLPNGAVYLGSGSLGYTNDRLKSEELNLVRNRQSPQAGPLTFGETPR